MPLDVYIFLSEFMLPPESNLPPLDPSIPFVFWSFLCPHQPFHACYPCLLSLVMSKMGLSHLTLGFFRSPLPPVLLPYCLSPLFNSPGNGEMQLQRDVPTTPAIPETCVLFILSLLIHKVGDTGLSSREFHRQHRRLHSPL